MPVPITYPGVYIVEEPSSVHTITGVPTAVAAFVGNTPRGPVNVVQHITSWADYQRLFLFGGLDLTVPMNSAVYLFFLNGGSAAEIVRAGAGEPRGPKDQAGDTARMQLSSDLFLQATSPGAWANSLSVIVDTKTDVKDNEGKDVKGVFDLTIQTTINGEDVPLEQYVRIDVAKVAAALLGSSVLNVDTSSQPTKAPSAGTYSVEPPSPTGGTGGEKASSTPSGGEKASPGGGGDGGGGGAGKPATTEKSASTPGTDFDPTNLDIPGNPLTKTGIYALARADIVNMLCLPTDPKNTYDRSTVLEPAARYCAERRAMLIIDPPTGWTGGAQPLSFSQVSESPALSTPDTKNAAVYYPNIITRDQRIGATTVLGPCGAVAGIWAATDSSRGVWKAPAGTAAAISGIVDLSEHIDDGESGVLNPLAVNCLRTLPLVGPAVWGARTVDGNDDRGSQWKYLPVRRTALFIEESLRRGTQWVVFEPNDEPLWSSIRLNVGAFMNSLFRQGAFQGSTPQEAYLVKCNSENNPQNDIDRGIVNILVGFAPLKPAEFVIIHIEQLAGQLQV